MKIKKHSLKFVLLITWAVIAGCPRYNLVMTTTDSIHVKNNSSQKIDILVNHAYPDTSFINAELNTYMDPSRDGKVIVVNRKWKEYLEEKGKVTVFFVESRPREGYNLNGTPGNGHTVLGKIILSNAILDSLDWQLTFPLDPE